MDVVLATLPNLDRRTLSAMRTSADVTARFE